MLERQGNEHLSFTETIACTLNYERYWLVYKIKRPASMAALVSENKRWMGGIKDEAVKIRSSNVNQCRVFNVGLTLFNFYFEKITLAAV